MKKHIQLSFIDFEIQNLIPEDDPLKILFESIDISFVYEIVEPSYKPKGAHGYSPVSLLKALLLIYLGLANSERDLSYKLKYNARLAFLCGFKFSNTPSHSTFHYFRKRLGPDKFISILSNLIAQASALIKKDKLSLSVDSTHIESFKSDKEAHWGVKETNFFFYGYKVHVVIANADPPIPLAIEVTPGNVADGKMLKPLVKNAKGVIPKNKSFKELLADAAYDSMEILSFLVNEGILPYIPENKRNKKNPVIRGDIVIRKDGTIVCKGGMKLIYWGYERKRKRYKFRCPLIKGEGMCLFKDICWRTDYGPVFYLHEETPVKEKITIIRNSPKFYEIYKGRSSVERFFSIIKREHRFLELRVKRIKEVMIHVALSIIAYILRLIAGNKLKVKLLKV